MIRKLSMFEVINEVMKLVMWKDENVILLGEDVVGGVEIDYL